MLRLIHPIVISGMHVFDALSRLSVPEMTLHRHHPERQLLIGIQSIIRCGYVRTTF